MDSRACVCGELLAQIPKAENMKPHESPVRPLQICGKTVISVLLSTCSSAAGSGGSAPGGLCWPGFAGVPAPRHAQHTGRRPPVSRSQRSWGYWAQNKSEIQTQNHSERCPYVLIDCNRPDFKYSVPFSEHVSDHMSTFMFKKIWYSFL